MAILLSNSVFRAVSDPEWMSLMLLFIHGTGSSRMDFSRGREEIQLRRRIRYRFRNERSPTTNTSGNPSDNFSRLSIVSFPRRGHMVCHGRFDEEGSSGETVSRKESSGFRSCPLHPPETMGPLQAQLSDSTTLWRRTTFLDS